MSLTIREEQLRDSAAEENTKAGLVTMESAHLITMIYPIECCPPQSR
jgi:hypothetical protein